MTGAKTTTTLGTYERLTYRNVWPGIDVAFRGDGGHLKYEFHVAPGADPSQIALRYRGADSLRRTSAGELAVEL